jgi:hypothetical protein
VIAAKKIIKELIWRLGGGAEVTRKKPKAPASLFVLQPVQEGCIVFDFFEKMENADSLIAEKYSFFEVLRAHLALKFVKS